jgi:uncharacterized protein (UPF0548 family)
VGHGPLWIRRPTDAQLSALLDDQAELPLSYPDGGITKQAEPPAGYHVDRDQIELGQGRQTFEAAVRHLRDWRVHRQAGLRVVARTHAEVGACVALSRSLAPICLSLACRVVYTSEAHDRWGFAYGTLPHHVERGEELFIVEEGEGGRVLFSVKSYSRPGHPLTALLGPMARRAQHRATVRYLTAAKALVEETPHR